MELCVYIGILLGYIAGLKIWDFYYEKIILPKIEKYEKQKTLDSHKIARIIGNPITRRFNT